MISENRVPEKDPPRVYLFHGDDEYAIAAQLAALQHKQDEGGMGDLNTTLLDGRSAAPDDLEASVRALPFLAERRLVILTNPIARLSTPAERNAFTAFLESVPASAALVLVENRPLDDEEHKKYANQKISDHWLIKWCKSAGERAFHKGYYLPEAAAMSAWIQAQAKKAGGSFRPDAAEHLSSLVGRDTRQAQNEIDKLLAYANYKRPVEVDDVDRLCADVAERSIFDMVDALGQRDGKRALALLNRLLETEDVLGLFGMVVRQFRLLLLTRAGLDAGLPEQEIARQARIQPFVLKKIIPQARQFTLPDLEAVYHRLVDLDREMKTGGIEGETALNLLFAALSR